MRRGGTSVLVFLINSAALTHSGGELELFELKRKQTHIFTACTDFKHQFELENDIIFQVDKIQYFRFIKTT